MKISETHITNKLMLIMMVIVMAFFMASASVVYSADNTYDYQPEDAKANNTNSMKMLAPSDISFQGKENGCYINKINGNIDGAKKEGIKFTFSLTAGMSSFSEETFIKYNMPQITIYDSEGNIAAQYSEGNGALRYLGENPEYKDVRALSVGVDQGVLDSGDYKIVFGKNIRGNNEEKVLRSDIVFYFHVKASPELKAMISQAEEVLAAAKVSETEPDCYPQSAVDKLRNSIQTARAKLGTADEDKASEELYQALKTFKNHRNFKVNSFTISDISETVSVGDSGKASALIAVTPDEEQYKKVVWSVVKDMESSLAADNIIIDRQTGRWIASYAGTVYLKAECIQNPEISTYKKVRVDSPEGVIAVNLSDKDTRLKTMVEKTGNSAGNVRAIKVFTTGTGALVSEDINYLKSLKNLQTMDLKDAYLLTIPSNAFEGNIQLKKAVLPNTVTSIGDKAFYGCTNLQEIEIPSSVAELGSSVFAQCTSMPDTLRINAVSPPSFPKDGILGSNINTIQVPYRCALDYESESGWDSLKITESEQQKLHIKVNASGELETSAQNALKSQNLTDEQITDLIISSPEGVQLKKTTDVDSYLKTHFLNATSIDLSGTQLERNKCNANTFKNRINLKYMMLPETTENIGKQSFYGCRNLKEIAIPKCVTAIGDGAFGGCISLNSRIVINAVTPPDSDGAVFPYHVNTILVPAKSVDKYKSSSNWRQYNISPQTEITLSASSISIEPFADKTITASVKTYGNGEEFLFWESSDSGVASVYKTNGMSATIRANKPGTAAITISNISGNVKARCTVKVKALSANTSSNTYNSIKISWSGITGAEGYYVHRYSSSGKLLKSWRISKSKRSFIETGLSTGTTYYYKVRAYKTGRTSVYSSLKTAKPMLSKPGTLTVSRLSSSSIKVKWKGVSGENGYYVYRAASKNGKYSKVATVKMTAAKYPYARIKAAKGKTYYYKVCAYKKVGSKYVCSSYSSPKAYKLK